MVKSSFAATKTQGSAHHPTSINTDTGRRAVAELASLLLLPLLPELLQ
jgi:hypothetical protein